LELWGHWRTKWQSSFYGDQGIFVRKAVFEQLAGFNEGPVLEDLDFSTRLKKAGKVVYLTGPLIASARRWETQGWWRTVWLHTKLAVLHALGVPNVTYPPETHTPTHAGTLPITIVIMAKVPVPGRVKTRLIPAVGPEGAAEIARQLLHQTIDLVEQLKGTKTILAVAPSDQLEQMANVIGRPISMIPQGEGDLGRRLARVFRTAFEQGAQGVLVVGTDHPQLPQAALEQGVAWLLERKEQVILGPTEDGGYYAVGLNRPHPELFDGIPWSTADVLEETKRKAEASRLPVRLLPGWFDLDRPEDLNRPEAQTLFKQPSAS